MRTKTTILVFFIFFITMEKVIAQHESTPRQHKFGVGVGYNFNTLIGDSIRPFELSFRYNLKDKHTFQLYVPILMKNNSFIAHDASYSFIGLRSVLKKRVIGAGLGYDYAVYSFSRCKLLIGMCGEYVIFNEALNLSNSNDGIGLSYRMIDYTDILREGNWLGFRSEIGIQAKLNRFLFDAKLGLYTVVMSKRSDYNLSAKIYHGNSTDLLQKKWNDSVENSFKMSPILFVSVSYLL